MSVWLSSVIKRFHLRLCLCDHTVGRMFTLVLLVMYQPQSFFLLIYLDFDVASEHKLAPGPLDILPVHSETVSISHHPSGSPFLDKLNNPRAEAPENTYTRSANRLPTLSRASWSNRTTTVRLLSNAFSHTPSQSSLPTALYIEAVERSWCLPCLGRETGSSLRTRPKPAEYVRLMDVSLEHMESSIMIIQRSPETVKKQYSWSWGRHWIIQHVPNYCSFFFLLCLWMSEWVCVCACVLLLGCCNVLELCTSVQMEKMFQLGAVSPAGLCPL